MIAQASSSYGSEASNAFSSSAGLIVNEGRGRERLVMTEQEVANDVLATLPKLKAAVKHDTFGRRWKPRRRKNGVEMFELVPSGGDDPNDDLDIAHAVVAKAELRCHLNEVLNVLINHNSGDYEASMQALCGGKFKKGRVLFHQRCKFGTRGEASSQDGLVGVQMATLGPKLTVKLHTKHKRTQKLCFSSCSYKYPSKDRAIHLMKTIPKDVHDQVVSIDDRSALRREIDHIAVGFDIQSKHGSYGAITHSTRVFLHSYASAVPTSHYDRSSRRQPGVSYSSSEMARRRDAIMNPEAHHVLDLLTKSLREMETLIRRRRLGFQTFVYFPTVPDNATKLSCSICHKNFSFFRRDFFCQLCGLTVCGECSRLYEVEARIGEVRKNRCCVQCIVRVDSCVYDDDELVSGLSPVIVDVDDDAWSVSDTIVSDYDEVSPVDSSAGATDELAGNLFSTNPAQRSQALDRLAQIVGKEAKPSKLGRTTSDSSNGGVPVASVNSTPKQVFRDIDTLLSQQLRTAKDKYANPEALVVYNDERDYAFDFRYANNANIPLAPIPEASKEAKRLKYIKASGVLDEKYDRAALDLLAQVAAKKLNCPIGFVSVVDDKQFRAIGTYNLPEVAHALPRDENLCMHATYAEKPMIIKNPQRDMRFAQMGAVKDLGVKFYAGFPVRAPDGSVVASLCTGDVVPHNNISTKDYATMEALSQLAAELIVPKSRSSGVPLNGTQPPIGTKAVREPSYEFSQSQYVSQPSYAGTAPRRMQRREMRR